MEKTRRERIIRYLLPFIAIGCALLFQIVLSHVVPKRANFPYAFFYLVAIVIAAWRGGYLAGTVTSLLTIVVIPYLMHRSNPQFKGVDVTAAGLVLATSLLVSKVASSQQRVRDILLHANDELDERVRTRTQDLARAVEDLESEVAQRKLSQRGLETQLGRLNLLDHITRAIGERQDLRSVFQVVIRTLEESMPIDFGCVCLYDPAEATLTVSCVGIGSRALATELAMTERAQIAIDQNGLARCVRGHLVYEPDVSMSEFPFPQRLFKSGLRSVVAAPLASETSVFGVLVAARHQADGFSSGDCEFLRQLSGHVALAAHQAQIHAALQQAYDDLRRGQEVAMEQERLRVLGQMASGIAHDINNALSPVAICTDVLLESEPNLSRRAREYLEIIQRSVDDVAHTVGRMKEFYRHREPQLTLVPVDLNSLVKQVLELTRARWSDMAQQRGTVIQMLVELEPRLPAVAGIESEIREALTNLILNAVDAMPDGGTLTVRTRTAADPQQPASLRRVNVQVEDTGVGMDEETRRRCLEPFFTTKGDRGTGLGLAMVYGVAQRQNAELWIESVLGSGTTVGLNFVALDASGDVTEISGGRGVVTRLPILIVDDDPLIIEALRSILESDGHAVTTASGGQEGIDTMRAAAERDEPYRVVITDLGMPHVDGRKVATAVKMAHRDTRVILLTGWGQRLVTEEEVPPNVDRVLNKPPRLNQLRSALSELTSGSASANGV